MVKAPGVTRSIIATSNLCYRLLPALCSGVLLCGPSRGSAENKETPESKKRWCGGHGSKFGFSCKINWSLWRIFTMEGWGCRRKSGEAQHDAYF